MVLGLVGETIDVGDEICGARVVDKSKGTHVVYRFELWLRNDDRPTADRYDKWSERQACPRPSRLSMDTEGQWANFCASLRNSCMVGGICQPFRCSRILAPICAVSSHEGHENLAGKPYLFARHFPVEPPRARGTKLCPVRVCLMCN